MNELWTADEFTCLYDGVTYNHRKEALQNQLGRASAEKITQILTDESLSITMPIAKSLELFPTERAATTAAIMEAFAALHKDAAEASILLSNMKSVITSRLSRVLMPSTGGALMPSGPSSSSQGQDVGEEANSAGANPVSLNDWFASVVKDEQQSAGADEDNPTPVYIVQALKRRLTTILCNEIQKTFNEASARVNGLALMTDEAERGPPLPSNRKGEMMASKKPKA